MHLCYVKEREVQTGAKDWVQLQRLKGRKIPTVASLRKNIASSLLEANCSSTNDRDTGLLMFSLGLFPFSCSLAFTLYHRVWIVYYSKSWQALTQWGQLTIMSRKFRNEMIPTEELRATVFLNPSGGVNTPRSMGRWMKLLFASFSDEGHLWGEGWLSIAHSWQLATQRPNCRAGCHMAKH